MDERPMQRQTSVSGTDHPQVVAIPPLVYAAAFGLGLILEGIARTTVPGPLLRFWVGPLLVAGGIAAMGAALRAFRAAGTHVEVYRPATALVTDGPYRLTRNPIYLGMTAAYLGAGLLSDSLWVLLLVLPVVGVIHYGVVLREEAYLGAKFGARYGEYARRVRRWL